MKTSGFAVLAALALAASGLAQANGTIVSIDDTATIERDGRSRPAQVGSPLHAGETLVTGGHGRAQVRFADDSVFALPAASALKVEQFQSPQNNSGGSAIFSLLRGGFRTITGLIGKAHGDKYEVRTGVATIGVRGSAYAAVDCQGQCGSKHKTGLYVKCEHGIIIVANPHGRVELRAGQAAYVASAASAPVRVKATPFDDPGFAADFDISAEFEFEVDPPRIEPPPQASPS